MGNRRGCAERTHDRHGLLEPGDALGDFFRFDLVDHRWEPIEIPGAPEPRGFNIALTPVPGALGVMLGGYDLIDLRREIWRLSR